MYKSTRHPWVTRLTNFSIRPTHGWGPPQWSSASPARHLPHNLGAYRLYCPHQDTSESAKMLNQMVLQDNMRQLGSLVALPVTIIQCDKHVNKSLNTLQGELFECNTLMGPNLFPIRNISKLFFGIHDKKNMPLSQGYLHQAAQKSSSSRRKWCFSLLETHLVI